MTQILANEIVITTFSLVPVKYRISYTAAMGIFVRAVKQVCITLVTISTTLYFAGLMFGKLPNSKWLAKKLSEWIGFGHKDTITKLKIDWLKFGKERNIRQIHQTSHCQTSHYCI